MGYLTKHARLAWKSAVHNCLLLLDGLVDLEQRKAFVSSFQNAVELCLKQYLIDKNDINVLHRRMFNDPSKSIIYNNCLSSSDYNSFFSSLSSADLDKIISSDFSHIVSTVFNNYNSMPTSINASFLLMQKLRNTETHFFIDENSYLNIDEFKELCKLMRYLQTFFINNGILENANDSTAETNKKFLGYFKINLTKVKSYNNLVIHSKTNLKILNQFLEFETKAIVKKYKIPRGWMFYVADKNDFYSIAHEIFEHTGIEDSDKICFDIKMNLNEFYRRFLIWVGIGLIIIDKDEDSHAVFACQSKKAMALIKKYLK